MLEQFTDEITSRSCTAHFDNVLKNEYRLKGKHLIQEPERFIEDQLVFPLLEGPLRHEIRPRPEQYAPRWPSSGGVPDFCLTTIPVWIAMDADLRMLGEVKAPNKVEWARKDMIKYLNKDLDLNAVTVLTDGFDWELWIRPRGQVIDEEDRPYAKADLRQPLKAMSAKNTSAALSHPHEIRARIDTSERAFSAFTAESVEEMVATEFGVPSSE